MISIALTHRFLRQLRGQIARELLELRSEPARQVALQCLGCGVLRKAVQAGGFLSARLHPPGNFARNCFAVGSELLFPFVGSNTALSGNGLRGGFTSRGMNLLT